jgi:glyoxylase-like metal-dependent hydrolase (beta-lactamase superfamily II)
VGWFSVNGKPYFGNATYWIPQADLDHFLTPADGHDDWFGRFGERPLDEVVVPVLPQTETWHGDLDLTSNVRLSVVGGHTPGSSLVTVQREQDRVVIVGDAIHSPLEITHPSSAIPSILTTPAPEPCETASVPWVSPGPLSASPRGHLPGRTPRPLFH